MPTFQLTTTLPFTASQKATLAENITNIHCTLTGADRVAVQVIFRHLAPEDHYHGGLPTAAAVGTLIWVHTICKSGRTQEAKDRIMKDVLEMIAKEAGVEKRQILFYMQEIDIENTLQFFDELSLARRE
ncbi:hypothetical protein P167DRAFT_533130 [Morchella conica CCBAS932]|uniref:Tautomerase cis-CaaD-like domain-containing protein n=2 Tax=Morchella sect. Distantes TaxID=1051054 RepID=A0A3N4KXR1_9PEZI|nr:hypothetical protein P167DRAFT_533130 [Morchella conica CCBAS932]